jgi:hypothetical protein
MGWSNDEDLIVVTDIGSIYMYDFDGTPLSQSSATSDIQDSRVIEAKVCIFSFNFQTSKNTNYAEDCRQNSILSTVIVKIYMNSDS